MMTTTQVSIHEYLSTVYQPDRDYVDVRLWPGYFREAEIPVPTRVDECIGDNALIETRGPKTL